MVELEEGDDEESACRDPDPGAVGRRAAWNSRHATPVSAAVSQTIRKPGKGMLPPSLMADHPKGMWPCPGNSIGYPAIATLKIIRSCRPEVR
jgi:hypothetical protein